MSSSPCSKQQVSKHSTQCVPLQENTSEVAPRSFASALAEKVDQEELSFSSSWSTLARCLHQGLRYGYVRVDSDEMYFVFVRQYSGEGRRTLQLLFASLAWVTVEQHDRDLQSIASTGHSIPRRSFQTFYLIALGSQYSPDAPPHGRLKSFSTAVIRMLRGRRTRPLESSGPCGNQDQTRNGATHD